MNKPLLGSNITYIRPKSAVGLISKYWSSVEPNINNKTIFVGDIHGDLHQFLAPLVMSGLITLDGTVKEIANENAYKSTMFVKGSETDIVSKVEHFPELNLYIPSYKVNSNCSSKIVFLGDVIHEWIFSRPILYMLTDLLRNVPDKLIFIYGNHDCNILAQYPLFRRRKLNIEKCLETTFHTMSNELSMFPNVNFNKFELIYMNSSDKGIEFMYSYMSHLFEPLYEIYSNCLGTLSKCFVIDSVPIIVSHTTWNMTMVPRVVLEKNLNSYLQDSDNSVYEKLNPDYETKPESKTYIMKLFKSVRDPDLAHLRVIREKLLNLKLNVSDYEHISDSMNDIFNGLKSITLSNNMILYNRSTEFIFMNHIIGHTPGFEWREVGINVTPCTYRNERLEKLKPEIINDKSVYYWDFHCSAGYDLSEYSRPDFVYVDNNRMERNRDGKRIHEDVFEMSNLPSFNFIINNEKDSMLICESKSKYVGDKTTIDSDDESNESVSE